ncbi:hypothetical protein MPLSOD_140022 [Mesorhizobium sp. SOD10]|nr:hypothetical protein MPLSOD_140022 [Mesorhizobium sp. SOD10]
MPSEDIFALQDEIALAAVGAIAPRVRKAEIQRVRRRRPDSLDAYHLVLQAQRDVDSGMPEQGTRALVLLEHAIALEPAYALAHGNTAMCHPSRPPEGDQPRVFNPSRPGGPCSWTG